MLTDGLQLKLRRAQIFSKAGTGELRDAQAQEDQPVGSYKARQYAKSR